MSAGLTAYSAADARELTERIKVAAEALWSLLSEAHEHRVWHALGYTRWEDYVRVEFKMTRSQSYRLLDQAKVIRAIAAVSPSGDTPRITEPEARDLKPVLDGLVERVRERTRGILPEEVQELVEEVLKDTRREQREARAGKRRIHAAKEDLPPVPKEFTTFFTSAEEMVDVLGMTNVSDEQFEAALADARADGDLTRANVVRKIKGKPTTGSSGSGEQRGQSGETVSRTIERAARDLEYACMGLAITDLAPAQLPELIERLRSSLDVLERLHVEVVEAVQ